MSETAQKLPPIEACPTPVELRAAWRHYWTMAERTLGERAAVMSGMADYVYAELEALDEAEDCTDLWAAIDAFEDALDTLVLHSVDQTLDIAGPQPSELAN